MSAMSTNHSINVKSFRDESLITLNSDEILCIDLPSQELGTITVWYKTGVVAVHFIGIDSVRRVRDWLAKIGTTVKPWSPGKHEFDSAKMSRPVQARDLSALHVRDAMSGVPCVLNYSSLKIIEWTPGPLARLNRTATIHLKNGETLTFNLSMADAKMTIEWMLANGAIHAQVKDRSQAEVRSTFYDGPLGKTYTEDADPGIVTFEIPRFSEQRTTDRRTRSEPVSGADRRQDERRKGEPE